VSPIKSALAVSTATALRYSRLASQRSSDAFRRSRRRSVVNSNAHSLCGPECSRQESRNVPQSARYFCSGRRGTNETSRPQSPPEFVQRTRRVGPTAHRSYSSDQQTWSYWSPKFVPRPAEVGPSSRPSSSRNHRRWFSDSHELVRPNAGVALTARQSPSYWSAELVPRLTKVGPSRHRSWSARFEGPVNEEPAHRRQRSLLPCDGRGRSVCARPSSR
jgi:hypothetical protein